MSTNTNTTIATNGRIKKERFAWAQLRRTFITKNDIATNKRLILLDALIGSILLYSLHTFNHTDTNLGKLQSFYSSRISDVTEGIRLPTDKSQRKTNIDIRINNTIPSIKANYIT